MSKHHDPMWPSPPPEGEQPDGEEAALTTREALERDPTPAPAPAEPEAPPADLKTPEAWRDIENTPPFEFGPAEVLHNWRVHALHANAGKLISRAAYRAAIEAGKQPNEKGEYEPAAEALGDFEADGSPRKAG